MGMDIQDLKKVPQYIHQLAHWHHHEWIELNPGGTIEKRLVKMQGYLSESFVPSTFVGEKDGELIGSAAIVQSDMDTHENLSPWLASVYVSEKHRRNGYGALLVKHAMEETKQAGIKKLYLFTPDDEPFYQHLGWSTITQEDYMGEPVTLMEVEL